MLSIPDQAAAPSKFADYLELAAISSPSHHVGLRQILSGISFEEDVQSDDWADEDESQEALLSSVEEVIIQRIKTLGDGYPFRTNEACTRLIFTEALSEDHAPYLFSLFLSHGPDRTILSENDAPEITLQLRNWFQSLSTLAAGGYVEGVAVSFGWPRPDRTAFAIALKAVYERFGEGRVRDTPLPAAPKHIKDGGVDIIAWKPSIDGLSGKTYLIGQVASGKNWKEKSVKEDARLFHNAWFSEIPVSPLICSMFMPFALEPQDPTDPTVGYIALLRGTSERVTDEFGIVLHRERLASYARRGVTLARTPDAEIDGIADLPEIVTWVQGFAADLAKKGLLEAAA